MFSRQNRKSRFLYSLADLVLTGLAFRAAYLTRRSLPLDRVFELPSDRGSLLLLFAALAFVLSGLWLAVYDRLSFARTAEVAARTARQVLAGALGLVVFEYVMRLDLSRLFLSFFIFYVFLFYTAYRLAAAPFMDRLRRGLGAPTHVLVVGAGEMALRIGSMLEDAGGRGALLIGFLEQESGAVTLRTTYPVHALSELPRLLEQHVVDEIVFAVSSERLAAMEDVLLLCDEEGVRTSVSLDLFPHVASRVYLDRLGDAPLVTFCGAPHDEIRLLLKRATDFALAAAALIVLSPVFLLLAALIRLTSSGPAIFGQERCGLNGRRFTLFKFRTMVEDAEARKAELNHLNVKTTAFKILNDPRVTPLGRWLRKFSVDEWPQLWNVVRGEMAIVGPRPAVPCEVEQYRRWQRRRLRMRPGLTCLWTLAGRDALDFDEWMRLDLAYIDRWSLALDWSIMLRTVPHVLTGKGAH